MCPELSQIRKSKRKISMYLENGASKLDSLGENPDTETIVRLSLA